MKGIKNDRSINVGNSYIVITKKYINCLRKLDVSDYFHTICIHTYSAKKHILNFTYYRNILIGFSILFPNILNNNFKLAENQHRPHNFVLPKHFYIFI